MKRCIALMVLASLPFAYAVADELPDDAKIACDQTGKECLAIGTISADCFGCQYPITFASHDGQKTWEKIAILAPGGSSRAAIKSIECTKELQRCISFGILGIGHDHLEYIDTLIITSHDAGKHWMLQDFGCGGLTGSWTSVNDHTCNTSMTNCVAVGACSQGLSYSDVQPIALYMISPGGWDWSAGIKNHAPYGKLNSVVCLDNDSNPLSCKATGEESDNGSDWRKMITSTKDGGKSWIYDEGLRKNIIWGKSYRSKTYE